MSGRQLDISKDVCLLEEQCLGEKAGSSYQIDGFKPEFAGSNTEDQKLRSALVTEQVQVQHEQIKETKYNK